MAESESQLPDEPTQPLETKPPLPLRNNASRSPRIVVSPNISEGLTLATIARIKAERASGNYDFVSGRPWWLSAFPQSDLKEAGLLD